VRFLSLGDRDLVLSKSLLPVLRQERKRSLTDLHVIMKRERGRLAKIARRKTEKQKYKKEAWMSICKLEKEKRICG
jgi:hypothetical protein